MISKVARIIGIIGMLITFILLGVLVYWQNKHPTYELSRIVSNDLTEEIASDVDVSNVTYDVSDISEINSAEDLRADRQREEPIYLKTYLKIPEIGVDVKIYEGLGKKALSYGAGTIKDGMDPSKVGTYAVAAHNLHDFDEGHGFSKFQKYREAVIGKKAYLSDGEYIYTYDIVDYKSVIKTDTMKYTDDDWVNQFYADYIVKHPKFASKVTTNKEYTFEGNYREVDNISKTYAPFISFYTCDVEKQGGHWVSGNRILVIGILLDKVKFKDANIELKKLFFDTTNGDESLLTETEALVAPVISETQAEVEETTTEPVVEKSITYEAYTGNNIVFNYINKQVSNDINFVAKGTKWMFVLFIAFAVWYVLFNIVIIDFD